MPVEIVSYKNRPILKITQEGSYAKLFIGIKKAQLIVKEFEAIKAFVASHIDKYIIDKGTMANDSNLTNTHIANV